MSEVKRVILSGIDGSSVSKAVCDYSAWMAKKMNLSLKLLHTIDSRRNPAVSDFSGAIGLGSRRELLDELAETEQKEGRLLIEQGKEVLQSAKNHLIGQGVEPSELIQRHGALSEALIDLEHEIGTLVLGIHGQDYDRRQKGIGTQLESIIRSIRRPILVVNKEFSEPKKVMLAYDGSESCKKALHLIISNVAFKDIPCHVVHVGSNGEALLQEATKALSDAGIQSSSQQLQGKIEEVLSEYQVSQDIDVMLMGAFSHNRIRGFLMGSFTAKMLENTNRPLFLLR